MTNHEQAKKEMPESKEKYRHLFENLNDAAFLTDAETGLVLETNWQATVLLGRSHDEIVGTQQTGLYPPAKADEYKQRFAGHTEKRDAVHYEAEVIKKNGTIVPVTVSSSTLAIGGRRCILAQFRDVTERRQAEDPLTGSENKLSAVMKRIIDSDYSSMEELVAGSDIYPVGEIHVFLNHIIAAWRANELTPAAMYALLKFVYMYLEQPRIQISFKNRPPIPICYFSSFLPASAYLLYSYLKILSLATALFPLGETNRHLREFIEKKRPPVVIFTISQFLHVHPLRQLVPYLHDRNLNIFIGGIPFVYDEGLKQAFSGCIFPRDLTELILLLENSLKEEPR